MKGIRLLLGAALFCAPSFASILTYTATLTGPGENPPNTSPGTGFGEVIIDTIAQTMTVDLTFANLTSGTTASHIHCCVAPPTATGVATTLPTFPNFPLGAQSGSYMMTFDLTSSSTYNPAFDGSTPAAQEATLLAGIASDMAYLNIHTANFPSGEIRGFLLPTPEPSAVLLTAGALGLLGFWRRRRATRG